MQYSQGVDLVRVEYIPDDKEDIVDTVKRLKQRVGQDGVIFSSGGIGPTHDDVTYEAIASAFGRSDTHLGTTIKLCHAAALAFTVLPYKGLS